MPVRVIASSRTTGSSSPLCLMAPPSRQYCSRWLGECAIMRKILALRFLPRSSRVRSLCFSGSLYAIRAIFHLGFRRLTPVASIEHDLIGKPQHTLRQRGPSGPDHARSLDLPNEYRPRDATATSLSQIAAALLFDLGTVDICRAGTT